LGFGSWDLGFGISPCSIVEHANTFLVWDEYRQKWHPARRDVRSRSPCTDTSWRAPWKHS
jgi:hypothetical protein